MRRQSGPLLTPSPEEPAGAAAVRCATRSPLEPGSGMRASPVSAPELGSPRHSSTLTVGDATAGVRGGWQPFPLPALRPPPRWNQPVRRSPTIASGPRGGQTRHEVATVTTASVLAASCRSRHSLRGPFSFCPWPAECEHRSDADFLRNVAIVAFRHRAHRNSLEKIAIVAPFKHYSNRNLL